MIKIGIIGLGHMGGYHLSACNEISSLRLVGIADPISKNWTKVKSSKVIKTKSYKDWLKKIDAVIIAVPTKFHYKIAKECLLENKHVLLEKPLTKNIDEATELFAIAKKNKLVLHVGHVERFNGAVQALKKIVHKPYLIESQRIGPFSTRPQNDSVILDLMIHDLDIILSLVNSPVSNINSLGSKIKTPKGDLASVQIKFENGILANIISSRVSQIKKRTMAIHQKNAFIQLDFTTQDILIHSNATDSVKIIGNKQIHYKQEGLVKHLFVYKKDNPLKSEIEHFIKSIKTGKKRVNANQDIKALELALKLETALFEEPCNIYNKPIRPKTKNLCRSK